MRLHRLALLVPAALLGTNSATAQCNHSNVHAYFGHDTYGYGTPPGVQGPSRPCQTMKAVTEGFQASDPSAVS